MGGSPGPSRPPSMPAETVPVPDLGQVIGGVSSGVPKLAAATSEANRDDRAFSLQSLIRDIMLTGGAGMVDPMLDSQIQSQLNASNKAVAPFVKQQSSAQTSLTKLNTQKAQIQSQLDDPATADKKKKGLQSKLARLDQQIAKAQTKLETATNNINNQRETYNTQVNALLEGAPTLTNLIQEKFPEAAQLRDAAQPFLSKMGQLGAAGEALQATLSRGFQGGTITATPTTAAQMGALDRISANQVGASRVGDFGRANATTIGAGMVGAGQLGDRLMSEAMRRVDLQGRLSAQDARDVTQATRAGMASRGLVTGNAALGAELLNRDRYQRQRAFEDLAFASGVQESDITRQRFNMDRQLEGDRANQIALLDAEKANLLARLDAAKATANLEQEAAIANQIASLDAAKANLDADFKTQSFNASEQNRVGMFNSGLDLDAQTRQEESNRLANQMNVGMLADAYQLQSGLNNEGLRAVALGSELASSANPYNQALGLYQGSGTNAGTAALGAATSLGNTWMQVANDANQFNANSKTFSNYAPYAFGNYGNMQSLTGSPLGDFALNTAVSLGSSLGSAAIIKSDRRMKENVRPAGKAADILSLPAYKFDYKDGKKNVTGLMAQDVKKVAPEAVTEFWHKGSKRLAIKPDMLGKALAQELMKQAELV